MEVAIDLFW